jgi:Ca-activated chloride channel family protein
VPESATRAHVPVALTLTIDTSGSMSGDKIIQARRAARTLVSKLKMGDMVAIHSFADSARELLPPTVIDTRTRQLALGTIAELTAGGGTNMFDAMRKSGARASATPASHPVRRIVMISDGRATVGRTDKQSLGSIAEHAMRRGVQVTSLGVGLDYDEATLNELAVRSSGRLYHLADASEMSSILQNELQLLQGTMATAAMVRIVPAPGVRLIGIGGMGSRWGSNGALEMPLGTMFAGQRRELVVRYRLSGEAVEGTRPLVSARLMFEDPRDGGLARIQEVVVRGTLTHDAKQVAAHENLEVQAILSVNQAAGQALAASSALEQDDFAGADLQLAQAEQQLRQRAKKAKTQRNRQRMLAAAEGMSHQRSTLQKAAAKPKPARRRAARANSLKLNDSAMNSYGY